MGKVYTRFQTKTAQKPYPIPDVAANTYAAYIREYLPPPPPTQSPLPPRSDRNMSRYKLNFVGYVFLRIFFFLPLWLMCF